VQKTFALHTEPHVADIGDTQLLFQPEVMGDDFMEAYTALRETQQASGVNPDELDGLDPDQLRRVSRGMRGFLAYLMLPESAALFTRLDVTKGGKVLKSFTDPEEADAYAAAVKGGGAKVTYRLRLPDRVLVELLEWTVSLYSGGQRPPTSSGGSAKASPPPGMRGTAVSPSKASTRARGR
jgi:hypothetical protein